MVEPAAKGVDEQARATLAAFVLRARRVGEHSLASDPVALGHLCKPSWQVTLSHVDGQATVRRTLPDEESVESLAARVRPVILQDDPVHHGKVLNALSYMLKDVPHEPAKAYIKWLRNQWKTINSKSEEVRAYRLEKGPADRSAAPTVISDNSLAFAWFYGDVVHADTARRESSAGFSIVDRFEAAVPVVARAAWLTHATLNLIEQLMAEGVLSLPEEPLTEQVTVGVTEIIQKADVYVAPMETGPPPVGRDLGPDWVPLTADHGLDQAPEPGNTHGTRD